MKLSVITVCYNSAATIERTINSVISQKKENIEYIIVDGNSTDGTIDILNKYRDDIDIIICEKDNGISDAFNKGIKVSSGDIIGIINSDDQYLKGAFELLFQNIEPETEILFGNGIRRYTDNLCKPYLANPDPQWLHKGMSMVHPATFIRKSAYEKYGLFNENFHYVMDREILLRMLNAGAVFQYSDRYYAIYQMGGISDRQFIEKVLPEEFQIDLTDGMSEISAKLKMQKLKIKYYLISIRNFINLDRKRVSLEKILSGEKNG